jgi:hypothetical protein
MKVSFRTESLFYNKQDWIIGLIPTPYINYESFKSYTDLRIGISIFCWQFELEFSIKKDNK